MKIVVIGANGTIGSQVTEQLTEGNEIIRVGKSSGDVQLDLSDRGSIEAAFEEIGPVDAVVNISGDVAFNSLEGLTTEEWQVGIQSRLMGQVNLTQVALSHLSPGGSITLTSGIIADHPIGYGVSAATLNGAVHHFVAAAATEIPNGIRINVVSPSVVTESLGIYGDFFPGFFAVDAADVAKFYVRSVKGVETGQVFRAYGFN